VLQQLWFFGSNSRCYAKRGRALGWKPTYTPDDFLRSVKPEIEAILESSK